MSEQQDSDEERISREALEWCIALQESPGDEDLRSRFENWRAKSPAHENAWKETERLSHLIASTGQRARPAASVPRSPAGARRYGWRRIVGGGVSAAIAACLLIFFLPAVILQLTADHITGTAEIRKVVLTDGSIVHLDAVSAIKLDYSPEVRRVELLAGQAYFDVKRDPDRPFKVAFGDAETTVLGTTFEVRLLSGSSLVAVSHGSVRVDRKSVQSSPGEQLARGNSLRLYEHGKTERTDVEPERVASWLHGKLIVKNRPVSEVVDTLRRHYSGAILQVQPGLGERRITGIYDVNRPVEALRAVALAHGLTVRQITPWVVAISGI